MAATVRGITLGRYSDSVDAKDDEVTLLDNKKIYLGTGSDLELYHDGSNSRINDTGTGNLQLQVGGTTKLEVTGTGVSVTGDISATGSVSGTLSPSSLDLADNEKILIGTGDDLEIYHDGSNSRIDDTGTGNLQLQVGGTTKLEVTSSGSTLTGDFTINDATPTISLVDTNDSDSTGEIAHTSGNLKLKADTNTAMGSSSIRFEVDGAEEARIQNGISFNGDSAADNFLNDYEQGSYTVTPDNSVTLHAAHDQVFYTKIGRLVTVNGQVRVNSDNSGANLSLNLPFTADNGPDSSGHATGAVRVHSHDYAAGDLNVVCFTADGWTSMGFYYMKDNTGTDHVDAQSNAYYAFTFTYTAT